MNYWSEFLIIVGAHALAVASPGPDFAIVLKQSLLHGRRTALWTSLGIGVGLAVHITYSLLGVGWLLENSTATLSALQYLGAAYLAFLGWQAVLAKPRSEEVELTDLTRAPTPRSAWLTGFLVNVLNLKAALFFIALFVLRVSPHTPKFIQFGYGVWMTLATVAWFSFVSVVFTQPRIRHRFLRYGHWIDRSLGVVFIGFALSLVLTSRR
jgi:RhtB (resistance to homoserine/threonine) family protein